MLKVFPEWEAEIWFAIAAAAVLVIVLSSWGNATRRVSAHRGRKPLLNRNRFHELSDDLNDVGISAVTKPGDTEVLQKVARLGSELVDLGISIPDGRTDDAHVANHFLKLAQLAKSKDLKTARRLFKREKDT